MNAAATRPDLAARPLEPCIGIVANPVSARDIRRIVANAGNLQITDRVNIVLRVLSSAAACGVRRALLMPDKGGIRALLERHFRRAHDESAYPAIDFLAMEPTSTVDDTFEATRLLMRAGVSAIVVLGGDGTHRAVASRCGAVPLATLSTGTNNAFPEWREATLVGLATALVATGRVPAEVGTRRHKRLRVTGDGVDEIALVDVALTRQTGTGARAVSDGDDLTDLWVAFAEPGTIGLASLAGLSHPVSRDDPWGLHLRLGGGGRPLLAPLLPGVVQPVGVAVVQRLLPGAPHALPAAAGTLAIDGEREIELETHRPLRVALELDGPRTIAVDATLAHAAREGLLFSPPGPPAVR